VILAPIITNRAGASADLPEFIQLAPKGEFPVTIGKRRYIQVIDDQSVAMLANSLAQCGPAGMLIDYDHFSLDPELPSEAGGWIKELQARPDGLWGRVEWTDRGADAVRNRRYIFISPTWRPTDCRALGGDRIRPERMRNAALTNAPNLIGIRPIVNRLSADAAQDSARQGRAKPQQGVQMDYKAKLIALLGLAAEATDEEIAAAIEAKTASAAAPAPEETAANREAGQLVAALRTERDTLRNRVTELEKIQLDAQIEKDLDEFKDVIRNREAAKQGLLAGRETAIAMLKAMRNPDGATTVHNRADARPPTAAAAGADDADTIMNRQREAVAAIRNRDRCSFDNAFARAQKEKPELFRPQQ